MHEIKFNQAWRRKNNTCICKNIEEKIDAFPVHMTTEFNFPEKKYEKKL